MLHSAIPIKSQIKYNYKRYIKVQPKLLDPYVDQKFKYTSLPPVENKAEQLHKTIKKRDTSPNVLKVFDDASLNYEVNLPSTLYIDTIDLSNSQVSEHGIEDMVKSPYIVNITHLDLSQNIHNVQDISLRSISECSKFNNLKILILKDSGITDQGIYEMFQRYPNHIDFDLSQKTNERKSKIKSITKAKELHETGLQFTKTDILQSARSQTLQQTIVEEQKTYKDFLKLPNLTVLVLWGNPGITDMTMRCLSYSESITALKYLDVQQTKVTDAGIKLYVESYNSRDLEYFDISYLGVTNASLEALSFSEFLKKLIVLHCKNSMVGNDGLSKICEAEHLCSIEELDFAIVRDERRSKKLSTSVFKDGLLIPKEQGKLFEEQVGINDKGMQIFAKNKYFQNLKILNLSGQEISEASLLDFIQFEQVRPLEELNVSNNFKITNNLLEGIIGSDKVDNLKTLNVMSTAIDETGLMEIQEKKAQLHVIHSIQTTKLERAKLDQEKAGIRIYECDQCARTLDPNICVNCKKREVTTTEFPARLCNKCGSEYKEIRGTKHRCFFCNAYQISVHQLRKCYFCSIGNRRYDCVKCHKQVF